MHSSPSLSASSSSAASSSQAVPAAAAAQRQRAFWPAVVALGVGGFAIGTGEFVIMGLLPEVARDLGVSIPQAGHVISAYALGVVLGAPVLAVLAAGWPRRTLLLALMALFALGNFASALAPGYLSLNLLRFIAGLPHGTYFGVAALVAAALAPPERRASAVGLVMSGLTSATLVGVPIAAWLGQHVGWRAAFVLVGAIAVLACVLVRRGVPDLPAAQGASPLRELGALAKPQVWLTLGIGAIGFGGMFAVFSYIKPTLIEVAGLSIDAMPLMLALFGIGMVVGNLVGSRLADKSLRGTIAALLVWNAVVLGSFAFTAGQPVTASISVFLIGTIVAIAPALQIRLMDVAGEAQTLSAALNHSAFNIANALGAWLGGVAIAAGLGWTSTGWVGTALALGGMLMFAASLLQERRAARRG
ncbi:MFS transporter [Azohydromonas caseinilytica]|uniref:MFS transporter n=1 Tax=Azohydromonas caseinilytica TaxID=2728836 RepID=A0A848FLP8_9BURK|nr:MFS transporter [Azohydromonas caseinilytica]NML18721.1 MFS transporter [Azohydromonas caseinilytica]